MTKHTTLVEVTFLLDIARCQQLVEPRLLQAKPLALCRPQAQPQAVARLVGGLAASALEAQAWVCPAVRQDMSAALHSNLLA